MSRIIKMRKTTPITTLQDVIADHEREITQSKSRLAYLTGLQAEHTRLRNELAYMKGTLSDWEASFQQKTDPATETESWGKLCYAGSVLADSLLAILVRRWALEHAEELKSEVRRRMTGHHEKALADFEEAHRADLVAIGLLPEAKPSQSPQVADSLPDSMRAGVDSAAG